VPALTHRRRLRVGPWLTVVAGRERCNLAAHPFTSYSSGPGKLLVEVVQLRLTRRRLKPNAPKLDRWHRHTTERLAPATGVSADRCHELRRTAVKVQTERPSSGRGGRVHTVRFKVRFCCSSRATGSACPAASTSNDLTVGYRAGLARRLRSVDLGMPRSSAQPFGSPPHSGPQSPGGSLTTSVALHRSRTGKQGCRDLPTFRCF